MICPKCGKEIPDGATFCGFCGATLAAAPSAPVGAPVQGYPGQGVPMQSAPMPGAPQPGAPMQGYPQQGAPMQGGFPQQGAPQPQQSVPMQGGYPQQGAPVQGGYPQQGAPMQGGYPQQPPQTNLYMQNNYTQQNVNMGAGAGAPGGSGGNPLAAISNLPSKTLDLINMALRGALIILGILIIIGSIISLARAGKISSAMKADSYRLYGGSGLGLMDSAIMAVMKLPGSVNLARVPAIISFVFSAAGAVLAFITKSRSLVPYISAGAGVVMFVFNFVEVKFSSLTLIMTSNGSMAPVIVSSIFLLISSVIMIGTSVLALMKKDDMLQMKKPLGQ